MNMVASEVKPFVDNLRKKISKSKTCEVVLCAPFPLIPALWRAIKDSRINIGAQNVSEYERGAYTGEASVSMLLDLGVKYVIIGHSERREYFKETDFQVNAKVKTTLDGGMIPIVCVGESHDQRLRELTMECIAYQVKAALWGVTPEKAKKLVIAYEPIWAIGTGNTATPEQTQEVCQHIRRVVRECYGAYIARAVSILYGGSMNTGNAAELLAMPDIDGGLIGGASLNPEDFAQIIAATEQG